MDEIQIPAEGGTQRVETVKSLLKKFPQELSWLTGDTHATPELGGMQTGEKSVGEVVFPGLSKDQVKEFDRTAVGLLTFLWVMDGDYDSFVECQPEGAKLSKESFGRLQEYTKRIVPDEEAKNAMCVYLVVNDLTKVSAVVEEMERRTGEEQIDHDVLLLDALSNHPDLSPSFSALSPKYKELIINGLKAKFNFGHLVQGEGPAAILTGLKGIDQASLDFYLIHVLYDTAGVVGHVRQNGSLVMTESTFRNMESGIRAIDELKDSNSEVEAYDSMLKDRASEWGLDVENNPEHKAVARIGCMLRLNGEADKPKVEKIMASLDGMLDNTRNFVVEELNRSGLDGEKAILLYYSPAIIANLETALKKQSHENAFGEAVQIALDTFNNLYTLARNKIGYGTGSGIHTVMCSEVATQAGKEPIGLAQSGFTIESVGADSKIVIQK